MTLLNIAHFLRPRLFRLFELGGRSKARGMLERLSGFLFDNYAVAGLQFENWMLVIGLPVLIILGYFFERGFHWRSAAPPPAPKKKSG